MHEADPMVNDLRLRNSYASEGKQEVNTFIPKTNSNTATVLKQENVETWKQLIKRKCMGCVGYMLLSAAATLTALWIYVTCYFSDQCPI